MEMAAGGSLTSYVADKWQKAQAQGLFLSEDEARFFFKVGGWVCGWSEGDEAFVCVDQQHIGLPVRGRGALPGQGGRSAGDEIVGLYTH